MTRKTFWRKSELQRCKRSIPLFDCKGRYYRANKMSWWDRSAQLKEQRNEYRCRSDLKLQQHKTYKRTVRGTWFVAWPPKDTVYMSYDKTSSSVGSKLPREILWSQRDMNANQNKQSLRVCIIEILLTREKSDRIFQMKLSRRRKNELLTKQRLNCGGLYTYRKLNTFDAWYGLKSLSVSATVEMTAHTNWYVIW